MRVRFASATGCVYGQLVVTAETEADRLFLEIFAAPTHGGEWKPHLHGYTRDPGEGVASVNLGWVRTGPYEAPHGQ